MNIENHNVQLNNGNWDCFSPEDTTCIFKYLNYREMRIISQVSTEFYNVARCNIIFTSMLETIQLLQHPSTALYKVQGSQLVFSDSIECDLDSHLKLFEVSKNWQFVTDELVRNHKDGVPGIHIWKALPPYDFTILAGIFIKTNGLSYTYDTTPIKMNITFLNPKKLDSLKIKKCVANQEENTINEAPQKQVFSRGIFFKDITLFRYSWSGKLDSDSNDILARNLTYSALDAVNLIR